MSYQYPDPFTQASPPPAHTFDSNSILIMAAIILASVLAIATILWLMKCCKKKKDTLPSLQTLPRRQLSPPTLPLPQPLNEFSVWCGTCDQPPPPPSPPPLTTVIADILGSMLWLFGQIARDLSAQPDEE